MAKNEKNANTRVASGNNTLATPNSKVILGNSNRSNYAGDQRANFAMRSPTTRMLLLSTFLLLFFTSCKDDGNIVDNSQVVRPSVGNLELCPSNPDNPYDDYGFHHNAAIDYYLENRTYFGTSFAILRENMYEVIAEYYQQTEMSNYYKTSNAGLSTPLAIRLYDSLYSNTFLKYSNVSNINLEIITDIINTTMVWEANLINFILENPEAMPQNDVKVLLTASSTLRYSTFYWYNDFNKPDGILRGKAFGNIDFQLDKDGVPIEPEEIRGIWGWVAAIVIFAGIADVNAVVAGRSGAYVANASVVTGLFVVALAGVNKFD